MYCFIFGFQRRVWCPKWTPASSRSLIDTLVATGDSSGAAVGTVVSDNDGLLRNSPDAKSGAPWLSGPSRGSNLTTNAC